METVGYLDQDHPDIVAHRQQQLTEILRLSRCLFTEDTAGDLRQAVHDLGDLLTEHILNILNRVFGIFHHTVQQSRTDGSGPQPHLAADNTGHGYRVHDVRLARTALYAGVRLVRKVERLGYTFHLAAMVGLKVILQQRVKAVLNHLFISRENGFRLLVRLQVRCVFCIIYVAHIECPSVF